MIEPILIVGIVIVCTLIYARHKWRQRAKRFAGRPLTGLEVLSRRYASGEIERDEYLQKKGDILSAPATAQRPR